MAAGLVPSWLSFFAAASLDLVFPPSCAACGRRTGRHAALCPHCFRAMRFFERPYCEILGSPFTQDLGPDIVSPQAIANPPPFDRLRSVAAHEGPAQGLVLSLKYRDRTDLAKMMAAWMLRASDGTVAAADAVLPVPLHPGRMLHRGFNQAGELARHLAKLSGKPLLPDALLRIRPTQRQVGLGASARRDNVRGAFSVSPARADRIFGRRLVLVDDVYTTGATVGACAKALRRAGAADITVLTFARAISETI